MRRSATGAGRTRSARPGTWPRSRSPGTPTSPRTPPPAQPTRCRGARSCRAPPNPTWVSGMTSIRSAPHDWLFVQSYHPIKYVPLRADCNPPSRAHAPQSRFGGVNLGCDNLRRFSRSHPLRPTRACGPSQNLPPDPTSPPTSSPQPSMASPGPAGVGSLPPPPPLRSSLPPPSSRSRPPPPPTPDRHVGFQPAQATGRMVTPPVSRFDTGQRPAMSVRRVRCSSVRSPRGQPGAR